MRATETKLLAFLDKSHQFAIPIYQRTYSWVEAQCQQLWDDIIRAGADDEISAHFVGSIVYIEESTYHISTQPPLLVIDGQQRLTTVSLIIEALARHLGDREPVSGFSAQSIRDHYLLDPRKHGELRYKLMLTQTDKQALMAIVDQRPLTDNHSFRVRQNFDFFKQQVERLGRDLESLCKGLAKLMIVDVVLERNHDNPQLIFESMNSTGLELSQADLIRNFVLMGLELEHQTRLYDNYWRPMEVAFGQEAYGRHFDGFMRHYLTAMTGEIPNIQKVYGAFKAYARSSKFIPSGVDALVAEVRTFASHYCAMALDQEANPTLAAAFRDFRELKAEVAYPLLLNLYQDYSCGLITCKELEQAIRLVESYVFRRAVCDIPTNSLNRTFATFNRALKKDRYLDSIQAHLLRLPFYRRFPSDEEFRRGIKWRDLYNFRSRSYWLRRLENYGRKEPVFVDEYTIEHILPQNENLSQAWQEDLGDDWARVHETWVHNLGNLTLTGYNSEYSDRSFAEKRDMEGGFKESPLRLNKGLGTVERWNETTIQARADRLADEAVKVWPVPSLPTDVLDAYRTRPEKAKAFTIHDHPHLATGRPIRALFDDFRARVKGIDPSVSEEFLKRYVSYKAETNFVDVVPQAKQLRLSLNLSFHELYDPRDLASDVSNVGHLGIGDVMVGVSEPEDLPYVVGLVRQSFEKQMGNVEEGM